MHANPIVVIGVVVLFFAVVLVLLETKLGAPKYSQTPILTHAETLYFHRLKIAADRLGLWVFPQVAFSAFMKPIATGKNGTADFRRISQKRADFVVVRADTLEIVCIAELDDASHDEKKDIARDRMTQSAGIVTIRHHVKNKVTTDQIYADLARHLVTANAPDNPATIPGPVNPD